MAFTEQSKLLKTLTKGHTLKLLTDLTGIKKSRLHRLISGHQELTLREAYLLYKALDAPSLISEPFISDHLYTSPMKHRRSKNVTIDNQTHA